jgi:hypothetical protein
MAVVAVFATIKVKELRRYFPFVRVITLETVASICVTPPVPVFIVRL